MALVIQDRVPIRGRNGAAVSVAGIILAAGESRRMGVPKALLDYHGESFLDHLIGLLADVCTPVVVVLGADAGRIRSGLARTGQAEFVVNHDWPAGQGGSLAAGLRALPASANVLFTLVDHPAVRPETLRQLLSAQGTLRIPRYQGRRGHPVYFDSALAPEFLALPPDGAARDVVNRHAAEIVYMDVDDPGVVRDIDDPAAYRALLEPAP